MATAHATPTQHAVCDLFESLLGKEILLRPEDPTDPLARPDMVYAVYDQEDASIGAVLAIDLSLACLCGAALSLIPKGIALEQAGNGKIEGNLHENFHEVVNVGASLFNRVDFPRLKLRDLFGNEELTDEIRTFLGSDGLKNQYLMDVDGYGKGSILIQVL